MYGRERRRSNVDAPSDERQALRAGLTPGQVRALDTLEQFQWTLTFVRRPMFMDPIPVVFDRQGARYAVLEPDGSLNENPGFNIRC